MGDFNQRIRQVLLLSIILLFLFLIFRELYIFIPGLLGAVTLYMLSRGPYFQLVYARKWKKGWAALLFIFYYLLLLGLPVYLGITLISPKLGAFLNNPGSYLDAAKTSVVIIQEKLGTNLVSGDSLAGLFNKVAALVPGLINSTANLISNLGIMLFVLYYMFYNGKEMEQYLSRIIPLKPENINLLASEAKRMIRANALGIPIISIIQGLFATLGYFIFGVKEFAIWGFLTGLFAFFPVVGTMIIWVPLVIYMYVIGQDWQATGLLLYSLIVTGNVDYISRITLLRRIGNVHPIVTILGVLVGLGLFGFVGLIFGPLLISYVIVLFNIYMNEFGRTAGAGLPDQSGPVS
ncbi:MAG TPA: AI-2E family transporter [Chitinophagaceae bacterium]|nr:AI-2E family transporter [Chitinophagaceae bacterium]